MVGLQKESQSITTSSSKKEAQESTNTGIYFLTAGNYVTLFNKSGHAIDIWAPKDQLAKPIFEQAENIFKNAETVVISCQQAN